MPTLARGDAPDLAYTDTGAPGDDRPVVVLSHGLLMTGEMFAPQVAALTPAYRCVVWDQRGHGATGLVEEPFDFWDSARDLLTLLDHVEVDRAVLVGMSQGGFLSLRAALLAPERVRALVLLDTQAGVEDPAVEPLYRAMAETWAREGADPDVSAYVASLILGQGEHPDWVGRWLAQPPEQVLQPVAALLGREDLTGRLGEIGCPALVVHGVDDAAIPLERARALAAGLPGAGPVVEVPGGHAANLTHPDAVDAALLDFLAGLPA